MAVVQNDVLEVTVIHENTETGEQINRFQFQKTDAVPSDDADAIDDLRAVVEVLYNLLVSVINIRNVLREVGIFNVTQDRLLGVGDAYTYEGGTDAGDSLPQAVSPFIFFKTDVPRVILSKYLPSGSVLDIDGDGTLSAGPLANVVSFGALLLAPFEGGVSDWVYGYLSPKTAAFEVPTLAVARDVLAYQRRRKKGRGS